MAYLVEHYGVEIRLSVSRFPGCCGGKIIHNFNVEGRTYDLTTEQKAKLYDALWLDMADEFAGTVVAMDCVTDFGDWEGDRGEGYGDTSWETDLDCGDISLEDFCSHHDFEVVGISQNSNSGNLVGAMVKSVRKPDEDCGGEVEEYYKVERPDFSDDERAVPPVSAPVSVDTAEVLERLRALVAGGLYGLR